MKLTLTLSPSQTKRILIHYLPLLAVTIYPFVYYIIIYFVRPCDLPLDYRQSGCGVSVCASDNVAIGLWDGIAHNVVPIFTIVIFSIALLGWVWYSKYRVNQRMQWRNYRKMAILVLSISAIYLIIVFPSMIFYILYTAGVRDSSYYDISYYLSYFATLLTPFVSVMSLPGLRAKLQRMIQFCPLPRCVRGRRILPSNHPTANQTPAMVEVVQ